jgi:hypothetical protein
MESIVAKNPGTQLEEWVLQELKSFYEDARRTKGSGSVNDEGDVHAGPFVVEVKDRPTQKSMSVTEGVWKKIKASARRMGKLPLVVSRTRNETFVTMRWELFDQLLTDARNDQA